MIAQSFYSNLKNTINVIIIVQKGYNINNYLNSVYNIIYTIYFKKIKELKVLLYITINLY